MTRGIGMLAVQCGRKSRVDMVFAILFIIALVGFMQDIGFKKIDQLINPHKYS